MHSTIVVKSPREPLRQLCRRLVDGRYILFDGNRSRSEIMAIARRAARYADGVQVVWDSEALGLRSISRSALQTRTNRVPRAH